MKTIGKAKGALAIMMLLGGSTLAMATEVEKAVPEKGTWQYDYAMETGTLAPIGTGTIEGRDAAPAEETVEIGGITYRIHIDLP